MHDLKQRFGIDMTIVASLDHAASFKMLASGQADAFATDDVLLYGLLAQNDARADFAVVGDFLSYDPYGVMYRKGDPQMTKLVEGNVPAARDGRRDRAPLREVVPSQAAVEREPRPADEPAARDDRPDDGDQAGVAGRRGAPLAPAGPSDARRARARGPSANHHERS